MAGLATAPAAIGELTPARSHTAPGTIEKLPNSTALDTILQQAVREDQVPGAVLVVGHQGAILHRKAYGFRALVPRREAMTIDTMFDAASLTKVIATTPAVMRLFEQGKLRLNDRVIQYLPEFQGGKSDITVRDLLTHFSGFPPDLELEPPWSGYDTGIRMALAAKPISPPGTNFLYSDINFILLGEIVRRLAETSLPDFVRAEMFVPLGMHESMFLPLQRLRARIAPTENFRGEILRGVVHDHTARNMGGVAGHAGLFTTAADLSRFAGMMLGGGELDGVRVFSSLTVTKFSTPQSPPDQPVLRGLGWDIDSPLSGNRGELFPVGSYGHTGFTGTSLWIQPAVDTFVIILTNRVHPEGKGDANHLRAVIANIVAASISDLR
jgi:CubicO group peptidase (beta-lactamase class C family)